MCKYRKRRGASVVQKGKRKMQVFENQALAFCLVPGAGIEPARIAPLVFETSASTDSAIRAGVHFCSLLPGLKVAREGCSFMFGLQRYRIFWKLQNKYARSDNI